MTSEPKTVGIACGIFKNEIEKLCSDGVINIQFKFLDSMLHLTPSLLSDSLFSETQNKNNKYILVYGDCCPMMSNLLTRKNIVKVAGINCCEILLGKEKYRQFQSDKTFILLHEWLTKFEDIFLHNFGFNANNIQNFFGDMHKRLVFLDTGICPVNFEILNQISKLTGLNIEIEKADLCILANAINNALGEVEKKL